jgi:hypothetical protein
MLTSTELHALLLSKMKQLKPEFKFHPLFKAILMEACENTTRLNEASEWNEDVLMLNALQLWEISSEAMKGLIIGSLNNGDIVNVDYRGETHSFNKNSAVYTNAVKN